MPDEEKTEVTEEAKAEAAKVEEAKAEETKKEETKDEISEETLQINKAFDEKMDSDDDDSATEDTSEEKKPEEKADEKPAEGAEEKDAGEQQTAEDKEVEEAVKLLEEQKVADAGKSEEQKVAEAVAAKAKVEAEEKAKEEVKDEPYDCGLDPDEYDEQVIKQFNQQGQKHLDEQKAAKAVNNELEQMLVQQANQRQADWLDTKFNDLGENFQKVLGTGEFADLEPASVQAENRIKVGNRMQVIIQAHQKLDKPVPSRTKLFDKAVSYLFNNEKNKSKTDADTVKKLKARSEQVIGSASKKASALSAASSIAKLNAEFDRKQDEDD